MVLLPHASYPILCGVPPYYPHHKLKPVSCVLVRLTYWLPTLTWQDSPSIRAVINRYHTFHTPSLAIIWLLGMFCSIAFRKGILCFLPIYRNNRKCLLTFCLYQLSFFRSWLVLILEMRLIDQCGFLAWFAVIWLLIFGLAWGLPIESCAHLGFYQCFFCQNDFYNLISMLIITW